MRRARTSLAGAGVAGVLILASTLTATQPAAAVDQTLVVNAGTSLRPVTHVAAGGLYALADPTTPTVAQVQQLSLRQLTQPPPGVQQLGNGATVPTGDALKVSGTVINSGAQEYVRMPDIYPNFPYGWVSWSDWLGKVDTMVKARLSATNTTNIDGWEIWNEPNWTWDTADAGTFNDGWTRTVNEVKSLDTVTPIVGPSIDRWDPDYMKSFLTAAKAAGTLPDVVSWHELLNGYQDITTHVAAYRALEQSLGISPRPISINEYAWSDQVDVPSAALHYIAQFERAGVHDAERAYWYESGTVNGLLYQGKPTANYWMYKWYGDMSGNMLPVTASSNLDGIASLDSTRKIVNVVFGGQAGDNAVRIDNVGSLGSSVKVTLSSVPSSGRQTNVTAPTVVSSQTLAVTNGSVTVPVNGMDAQQAYQVLVTPAAGATSTWQKVYEAENATVVNAIQYTSSTASNGGYIGGIDGTADMRNQSFVDFTVNVPSAGNYTLAIRYANGWGATSTQGLAYNGGGWQTVSYPTTAGWGQFGSVTVPTALTLNAGYNVIRLAKGSPGFTGTGYAELDDITLTQK